MEDGVEEAAGGSNTRRHVALLLLLRCSNQPLTMKHKKASQHDA